MEIQAIKEHITDSCIKEHISSLYKSNSNEDFQISQNIIFKYNKSIVVQNVKDSNLLFKILIGGPSIFFYKYKKNKLRSFKCKICSKDFNIEHFKECPVIANDLALLSSHLDKNDWTSGYNIFDKALIQIFIKQKGIEFNIVEQDYIIKILLQIIRKLHELIQIL